MKIPEKHHQFENQTALIITTGTKDAAFYIARDGEINAVESFRVEKPKYTDIEGHFERRGEAGTYKAGSPYDPTDKNEKAESDFLKELGEELKNVSKHHRIDQLIIFTPGHAKNEVQKLIPYELSKAEQVLITGNYYDEHPRELIAKFEDETHKDPVKPMRAAARKILDKFKSSEQ